MEKKKLKVGEFAALVGCSPKAIYGKIERDKDKENKEIITEVEVRNGREITVIVTDDKQIREFQKMYGNLPVNEVQYEETVTYNEGNEPSENYHSYTKQVDMTEIVDKIITLSEGFNDSIMKYSEELISVKSKQLLLEDKAGREGLYLQEIKDVKKEKETQLKGFVAIITVISMLLVICLGFLIFKLANPTIIEKQVVVEKRVPVVKIVTPTKKVNRR